MDFFYWVKSLARIGAEREHWFLLVKCLQNVWDSVVSPNCKQWSPFVLTGFRLVVGFGGFPR